jgi:glycosyltransferase involved in cell wall biosynthesis
VGNGSKINELKAIAKNNIEFRQGLSNEQLSGLYANCKAFIFPQHEDYGITPLEANASGRPVIAYGAGGVLDTMIPYVDDASKSTAVFFDEQTASSLINAVVKFEGLEFDPIFIRANAEKFDEQGFIYELKSFVEEKYKQR